MDEKKSYLYLGLTILSWSATPAVAKLALGEVDNFQLLFYTSIVGVLSLFLVNLFKGKLSYFKEYSKKDYLKMFGMGALGIFLYHIFLYSSFGIAPAGQVNVINYLWPVFVVIFSIPLLNEKFNYKTILGILFSFFGAFIAFTRGDFSIFNDTYILGCLLAACGAVCYGLFSVLGKRLDYEKYSSMLFYYLSSAILIIPTSLIISGFVIPRSLTTIISIFILGGLMNSIAFVFWFKALKFGDTHKITNYIYVVPFLGMIWTYFLNSEPLAYSSIIGLCFIITGILIQAFNKK